MSTIQSIAKFRPVLSATKILHIIALCKKDGTKESMEIVADLARFEWQIRNDAITPAYVVKPKESLASSLGFGDEKVEREIKTVALNSVEPETLYQIWLTEPETLLAADIARVREWRYHNNKMTMDEEKLFEREVLGMES